MTAKDHVSCMEALILFFFHLTSGQQHYLQAQKEKLSQWQAAAAKGGRMAYSPWESQEAEPTTVRSFTTTTKSLLHVTIWIRTEPRGKPKCDSVFNNINTSRISVSYPWLGLWVFFLKDQGLLFNSECERLFLPTD